MAEEGMFLGVGLGWQSEYHHYKTPVGGGGALRIWCILGCAAGRTPMFKHLHFSSKAYHFFYFKKQDKENLFQGIYFFITFRFI